MHASARHVFDTTASHYDRDRARLIPGFDSFYRWAVDLIPAHAASHEAKIVDLGAGTGLLSAFVRARMPRAHLHLIDISEAMLAKARHRFAGETNMRFEVADYASAALPGELDAVVSALSVHHLTDQSKRDLFARIYQSLKPRGVFINAEQVLGPTPELESRYKALWLEQVRGLGAGEDQIAESLFRQQQDRCAPVEAQLAWMREAGFADADCWFKEGRFAVLAGTRN
jgi:tRNA (cmo5U34)-methyltransferase